MSSSSLASPRHLFPQREQQQFVHHRRRIPPRTKSNRTAVLCLLTQNEQLYLNEFVDYHLAIGFDEISIWDSSPDYNLKLWGQQKQMETAGRISVSHYWTAGGFHQQPQQSSSSSSSFPPVPTYHQCWQQQLQKQKQQTTTKHYHTWLGILKVDEFLVLREPYTHVVDFLEHYYGANSKKGALSMDRMVFGHSQQTRYRPYPLSQRFRYRSKVLAADSNNKITLAKISHITSDDLHNNFPVYPDNFTQIFDPARRIQSSRQQNVAVIYHYWLKSIEEWYIQSCFTAHPPLMDHTNTSSFVTNATISTVALLNYKNCFGKPWSYTTRPPMASDVYDDSVWQTLKQLVPPYATLERTSFD